MKTIDCAGAGSDSANQAMARNRREVIICALDLVVFGWLLSFWPANRTISITAALGNTGPQVVTLPLSSTKVGLTMKSTSVFAALVVSLGLAAGNADAAKRFGGGGNVGKQRPAPTP